MGCAFEVLRELGHGLHEQPYENALAVEFGIRKVPVEQQTTIRGPRTRASQFPNLFRISLSVTPLMVDAKVIDHIA